MTTPSEQWIVSALREATDRMPLPPESRWIRQRRSAPSMSMILLVGVAAILIVAVGMTIGALRVEPRLVPAAAGVRSSTFAEVDGTEWRIIRFAVASDLVLLHPTWVPAEYRGSVRCPSPQAIVGIGGIPSRPSAPSGYSVEYRREQPDGRCASLYLYGQLGTQDDMDPYGIETSTFDARGTTVHVQTGVPRTDLDQPPPFVLHLWWNEPGAHYDMLSNDPDLELVDLIRMVRSIEPMR